MRSEPLRSDVAPLSGPCNRLDSRLESRGCSGRQGEGSHGPQRFAVARRALVVASKTRKMLGELEQLLNALRAAPKRRGPAQRAVSPPGQPSREPRL